MIRRRFTAALVATLPLITVPLAAQAPEGTPCANLAVLTIPNVVINAATAVAAGAFDPPGASAPITLPAFCRVEATARPTSDSDIKFEVWIPPTEAWNGKFQGVGNGGYMGSISYTAMAAALRRGYATASTDTGHSGDDVIFGQGHPEKVIDYGYRAIHVMTETAKLVIRNATGRFAERSYFVGCSAGGHQALSEAQRYPNDYDGIVAGAPANNRIRQTFGFLASWMATHDAAGTPLLNAAKLALVTRSVTAACDANDGLKDGLVDDPRRCTFNPATLACKAGPDDATCLTPPQVTAVQRMYEGTKSPKTGAQIYTGWPRGSEAFGETANQGWRQYIIDPKEPSRVGVFKYFLFHNPNWDFRTIDWDRDLAYAEEQIPHIAAVDTNLAPFKKRGGKLLVYGGWLDPVVPPQTAVAYYEGVAKTMGGQAATQDFFRLFMAPGMGHCAGGPGPNQIDAVTALEQWVEKGVAPESLLASHSTAGKVDRTRPLCVYPKVARYKGTGSIDEAANFTCVAPPAPPAPRPQ
jgi:feruloyl esterase